jgi:hypothetical protein
VAKPGTSAHEGTEGNAYDIDPKKLTKSGRAELAQKGYYQPYGVDSVHWEKIPSAGTNVPVAKTLDNNETVVAPAKTPVVAAAPAAVPEGRHETWSAPLTQTEIARPKFANPTEEANWYEAQKKVQTDDATDKSKMLAGSKMFEPTLNTINDLRNDAKGRKEVFNLPGKHWLKAGAMDLLHMTGKTPAEEQIARQNLSEDSQTAFKNITAGAAKIQSDKAISDAQTGGGRLSRMGQELAGKTKGVGTDSTYGSFMTNLARLEEETRTKHNQIAFANAHKDVPMSVIEQHPYWTKGAREDARRETAKNFYDIPEANYQSDYEFRKNPTTGQLQMRKKK